MTITFDTTQVVDSGGWDMVVGLPLPLINTALAAQASGLDLTFRYTGASGGQSYAFSGTFGPWSITGGSGQDLTLSVPIASGTFSATGMASGPFALPAGPVDLSGTAVAIGTRLQFQTPVSEPETSTLVFAFDPQLSQLPTASGIPSAGALTGGGALPAIVGDLLPFAVASCLAANIAEMNFVFATLTTPPAGSPAPASDGGVQWQYAVASQQDGSGETLAIFYTATPNPDLPANIPAQISVGGDQCVVILSRQATLETIMIPAIVSGLDHTPAPWSATAGIGLLRIGPPPASNAISPSSFVARGGAEGGDTGTILAPQPIVLNLGVGTSVIATLSNYTCTITGTQATMVYEATISNDPGIACNVSQIYDVRVGIMNGTFSILLCPSGPPSINPAGQIASFLQSELSAPITTGLGTSPLPFDIALFDAQQISPQQGYLNGGLALAGPIVQASQ